MNRRLKGREDKVLDIVVIVWSIAFYVINQDIDLPWTYDMI